MTGPETAGRVDHATEARKTLEHTLSYCATDDNTEALVNVAAAQVRATLALVEQQRIANILALGQYKITPGDMPIYRGVIFDGENVKPEIREALGL